MVTSLDKSHSLGQISLDNKLIMMTLKLTADKGTNMNTELMVIYTIKYKV